MLHAGKQAKLLSTVTVRPDFFFKLCILASIEINFLICISNEGVRGAQLITLSDVVCYNNPKYLHDFFLPA